MALPLIPIFSKCVGILYRFSPCFWCVVRTIFVNEILSRIQGTLSIVLSRHTLIRAFPFLFRCNSDFETIGHATPRGLEYAQPLARPANSSELHCQTRALTVITECFHFLPLMLELRYALLIGMKKILPAWLPQVSNR